MRQPEPKLRAFAMAGLLGLAASRTLAAADGALDPSFNGSGMATVAVGGIAVGLAAAAQPDGKVLVAGRSELPTPSDPDNVAFVIARHNADGTADSTFGPLHDGAVTVDFDLGEPGQRQDVATAIALQPDGRIVVAGYATVGSFERHLAVARLTRFGILDPTFGGGDGKVTYAATAALSPSLSAAVLVRRDGRIVLTPLYLHDENALLQLQGSGDLDPSFGDGGRSEVWGCCGDFLKTLEMPDGNLLTLGTNVNAVVLARFVATGSEAGSFDAGFGDGGVASFPLPEHFELADMALDTQGRVMVLTRRLDELPNTGLLRLRGDQPDPTYGIGGWSRFTFLAPDSVFAYATALVVQPDGKPVLAGDSFLDGNSDVLIARRTANGNAEDSAFSGGTRVIRFDLGGELADRANAVLLSGGRAVVAGSASADSGAQLALARLDNALLWSDGFESGSTWFWSGPP